VEQTSPRQRKDRHPQPPRPERTACRQAPLTSDPAQPEQAQQPIQGALNCPVYKQARNRPIVPRGTSCMRSYDRTQIRACQQPQTQGNTALATFQSTCYNLIHPPLRGVRTEAIQLQDKDKQATIHKPTTTSRAQFPSTAADTTKSSSLAVDREAGPSKRIRRDRSTWNKERGLDDIHAYEAARDPGPRRGCRTATPKRKREPTEAAAERFSLAPHSTRPTPIVPRGTCVHRNLGDLPRLRGRSVAAIPCAQRPHPHPRNLPPDHLWKLWILRHQSST